MSSPVPPAPRSAIIAIVDDDARVRSRVEAVLLTEGHRVVPLDNATKLLELVRRTPLDLVLLDVMLEGMNGVEAMRLIKSQARDFLPVVLLTARTDPESRAEGLRLGADDYIGKPFDDRELVARVEAMLRIKRRVDDETGAHRRLAESAFTDDATGLWNTRYLQTRLVEELQRAARHHDPLALAILSLVVKGAPQAGIAAGRDSLARDPASDTVLREVGARVRGAIRMGDLVARFGATELVMLLPTTHMAGALEVVERVLVAVAAKPVEVAGGRRLDIAGMAGLAVYPARGVTNRDSLLRAADLAARRAETEGPGALCVHHDQTWVVERPR